MEVVDPEGALLICGLNGQGKRTKFDEYPTQKRGGSGVIAARTSGVSGALTVFETDEMMMLTKLGQAVRTKISDINIIGRATKGVRCINLAEKDQLLGVARIVEIDEDNKAEDSETAVPEGES